jgi:hypothetical protein
MLSRRDKMIVARHFIARDPTKKGIRLIPTVSLDRLLPPSQPYIAKSLQCLYQIVPYGTGFFGALSQAVNCQATLS